MPGTNTAPRGRWLRHLFKAPRETYAIAFQRRQIGDDTFLTPRYAEHRPAVQEILAGRLYEPATHVLIAGLMRVRPGSLIHAGTFFGDMLPSFSRVCPGTVLAFEPVLENYVLAKLCLQENDLRNVILLNAGLGDQIGTAHIDVGEAGAHRGGTSQIAARGQRTALLTIDALAPPDVTVIQLDVEGHELPALRGAAATIATKGPIVLIEDNDAACGPHLSNLGYSLVGTVPGLDMWCRAEHRALVEPILSDAQRQ